jgi:hypothetical protein
MFCPNFRLQMKIGTTNAIGGVNIVISVATIRIFLILILLAANTNPASVALTVAKITIEALIQIEFNPQVRTTPSLKDCKFLQAVK